MLLQPFQILSSTDVQVWVWSSIRVKLIGRDASDAKVPPESSYTWRSRWRRRWRRWESSWGWRPCWRWRTSTVGKSSWPGSCRCPRSSCREPESRKMPSSRRRTCSAAPPAKNWTSIKRSLHFQIDLSRIVKPLRGKQTYRNGLCFTSKERLKVYRKECKK